MRYRERETAREGKLLKDIMKDIGKEKKIDKKPRHALLLLSLFNVVVFYFLGADRVRCFLSILSLSGVWGRG